MQFVHFTALKLKRIALKFQVENALDANAKHIRIFINREFYKLQVIDDGIGMTIEDMNFVGIR